MSTFRQEWQITLDDEIFKCQSRAIDWTNAEQAIAREGGGVERPVALQFRIAFSMFRRDHPEHPASRAFGPFMEIVDEVKQEAREDAGDPLDPTHLADSDD
jgi:hypothetical protein